MQVESLSGVLSENNNTNKQVLSPPSQSVTKTEKAQVSTPRNHLHSSASLCLVINSPSRARNTEGHHVDNETRNENFSMYIYFHFFYIFPFLLSVVAIMNFASSLFTVSVELHSGEVLNLPRRGNHRFT